MNYSTTAFIVGFTSYSAPKCVHDAFQLELERGKKLGLPLREILKRAHLATDLAKKNAQARGGR